METLPRASYGFFSDYTKSLRLWFKTGYKSELKGIQIGKMNKIFFSALYHKHLITKTKIEHVLNGATKEPISLNDYRLYVQKKEHSGENLEFHYWLQNYKRRFDALPADQKERSPPPTEKLVSNFSKTPDEKVNNSGQPFREEVNTTIEAFFNIESLKALNLPSHISDYTVYCSSQTTHPDVFEAAYEQIYTFMKERSVKQFIHYSVQNIRNGYVVFQLAYGAISFALIPMLLFNTYSMHMSRWSRAFLFMFVFFCCLGVLSAKSGFCILRSLFKVRQVPAYNISLADKQQPTKLVRLNRVEQQDLESNNKQVNINLTQVLEKEVIKYHRVSVIFTIIL